MMAISEVSKRAVLSTLVVENIFKLFLAGRSANKLISNPEKPSHSIPVVENAKFYTQPKEGSMHNMKSNLRQQAAEARAPEVFIILYLKPI